MTNHSNAPIVITPTFSQTAEQQATGLRCKISAGFETVQIDACSEGDNDGEPGVFMFEIDGNPSPALKNEKEVSIGTLTVALSSPGSVPGA